MKKLFILFLLLFVMVGCTSADESRAVAEYPDDHDLIIDHEQMINDLLERIAELEEELGNLKEDLDDGLYE